MDGTSGRPLSAELIDGITEAVASPTDPRVRADVIAHLVHEVDEAVKWRNERHPGGVEEQSLATLVTAAEVHRHRMDDVDEMDDDSEDDQLESDASGRSSSVTERDFQALAARSATAPAEDNATHARP